jgi:hypothetical protein
LYKKYSSSQNYYYIKDVNEIISDSRTPTAIEYKQIIDYSLPSEQLKKFVELEHYDRKMRSLVDYYRYHKEIPRVFAKSIYDLYFDHHDRKRKVEYVIITRNLKNSKMGEDPKKALEDRLRKQKGKKFDPMLKDLPQYSFVQKYYHHKNAENKDVSKSLFSVYDKLYMLVNSSKMLNQSFNQTSMTSENVVVTESDLFDDQSKRKIDANQPSQDNRFNFLKRKGPEEIVPKEALVSRTARHSQPVGSRELFPNSALSTTRRDFRYLRQLELNIEHVEKRKLLLLAPKESSSQRPTRVQRGDSRSKQEYGNTNAKSVQRGTVNSLKHSRNSENDRKRLSMERKEIESNGTRNFGNKTYWKSLERTVPLEDEATSLRPKSQSKKKKKCGDALKRSINFNFNWTKVNKMLTNPLLINKSMAPSKALTQREKADGQLVKMSTFQPNSKPKNYLDQKSKLVKGYHHKVNSMLMSQINQDLAKRSQENNRPSKLKFLEKELFSRKNSLKEVDIKAMFSQRLGNDGTAAVLKPKFISHSKKNSMYNVTNLVAMQNKKPIGQKKKKHKKAVCGFTYDQNIGKTIPGTLALTSEKEATLKTGIFDQKKTSAQSSNRQPEMGHKYSKSEAESMLALKMTKVRRFGTKKLSSDFDAK